MKIECLCIYCKKVFYVPLSKIKSNGRKYCSLKCRRDFEKATRIKRKCQNCGKDISFKPSENTNGRGKYCSRKCKGEYSKNHSGSVRHCVICGKEYYIKGNPPTNITCSKKCGGKYRRTGKTINCAFCGKEVYKNLVFLKNHKNHFCSRECANKYQGKNKIKFICKICGREFTWSKSRIQQTNPTYCTVACRNKDHERWSKISINTMLKQQNKKGLNKLELAGREILKTIGIEFIEQVALCEKFIVDVFIPSNNLIIQWDGIYWHTRPKRAILDKSQDAYLVKCGYKILRITDQEIKNNKKQVYINIIKAIGGTCGMAAKELNRNFIGFDNDPVAVEVAQKRIASIKGMQKTLSGMP